MCVCADNCPVDADCSFGADAHSLHDLYQRSGEPLFHFPPSVTLFSPSFCSPSLLSPYPVGSHSPVCTNENRPHPDVFSTDELCRACLHGLHPHLPSHPPESPHSHANHQYFRVHYITLDTEGRVHIITDRAGTLDKQSPLDKSESGTGERLQYY